MGITKRHAIGTWLRERRLALGMAGQDVAAAAGISASQLSRIVKGRTTPSFTVGATIAAVLELSLQDMATTNHELAAVDEQRVRVLASNGIDYDIALHIQDQISLDARGELLVAVLSLPKRQ